MELPDHLVQGVVKPHLEDSMAPAEHLNSFDIEQQLRQLGPCNKPGNFLDRAWIYTEYALATVDTEDDDRCFTMAHDDVMQVLDNKDLGSRHQQRFAAAMLLAYEPAFRMRANSESISPEVCQDLQATLGELMLGYIDGREPTNKEYGQLSELVVASYLLNGELFPYLASRREEANIVKFDNHDLYTLHPCSKNRIKKAPMSVKYRERLSASELMVNVTTADVVLEAAASVPPYDKDPSLERWNNKNGVVNNESAANGLKLAADIMICKTTGEVLSVEDLGFLWNLTARLQAPLVEFADRDTTPDYASNAEALRQELAARQARLEDTKRLEWLEP